LPRYASGIIFTVCGAVSCVGAGVLCVCVGVADGVVRVGEGDAEGTLLVVVPDVGLPDGEKRPIWFSRKPASANRSNRISATRGQVQGLRPFRRGSSEGASS
jgi:hypothetical protein